MKDKRRLLVFLIPFVWWGVGHLMYLLIPELFAHQYVMGAIFGGFLACFGLLVLALLLFLFSPFMSMLPDLWHWIFEKKENGRHNETL